MKEYMQRGDEWKPVKESLRTLDYRYGFLLA